MKAHDVRPGQTVLCCDGKGRGDGHRPQPIVVTRIIRARGTRRIAFGYTDTTKAARDTNGITQSYLPHEQVLEP